MEAKEKRVVRTYKIKEKAYSNAIQRAVKEGGYLTTLIENVVTGYGEGAKVIINFSKPSKPKR